MRKAAKETALGRPAASVSASPEETMRNIVDVATAEFANKGFAGARVDEIAALTKTSKRMIYYYFGGKEQLYLAVLEETFRRVRQAEAQLRLGDMTPEEGLRALVKFRFDYHHNNPDFVRLVMNENIHEAGFLSRSNSNALMNVNSPAIEAIRTVYEPGCAKGIFRPGLDLIDIHLMISSLSFFSVSNRHTFSLNFNRDISAPAEVSRRRDNVVEMIWRFLKA
ncbi:MAG: TetR/AcrR family transcriptional regulator [Pseudomonadota bacterium]